MATSYKTPGVFVEEISKLPPSVAQVETAIPAFVGYTQKATNLAPGDLLNNPTRIGSLVEFEFFYGTGPALKVNKVNIDSSNNFLSAEVSGTFFLYDSLRMFYANGGGDCYIVSIGVYPADINSITAGALTGGLKQLEKVDEPAILLFPDAVNLGDSDLATVQQAALSQAGLLQDRVGLFDLKQNDPKGINFRANVGINNLSYGAAYTPWLKVALPKTIRYTDVKSAIYRSGIPATLAGLTADTDLQTKIGDVEKAYTDRATITTQTGILGSGDSNLWTQFTTLETAFNAANNNGTLHALFNYVFTIALKVDTYISGGAALTYGALKTDVTNAVTSNFVPAFTDVEALEKEAVADYGLAATDITALTSPTWDDVKNAVESTDIDDTLATDELKRTATLNLLKPLFDEINRAYISLISDSAAAYTKTLDDSLALSFPLYKNILSGVSKSMTAMPPSGAIAGVYASVDRTRGVWKAPANVSLNNVVAPDTMFTATELDALNVDAVAGKSINAIRAFAGKGTLVYGARTLAGNDNEWRYISVRRFFNMAEESCKNASGMFVFEPNDANTWVKVQGMIENFLTTLWRQGALQGAKPEHAFYVAVGLNKTMTALDILEGRMIVEIGMAVVRPAEFIILRFSHKMAES